MLILTRKALETLHYADSKLILTVTEILPQNAVIQVTGSPFIVERVASKNQYKDGESANLGIGEALFFGKNGEIEVELTRLEAHSIRLASKCPKEIRILRGELL